MSTQSDGSFTAPSVDITALLSEERKAKCHNGASCQNKYSKGWKPCTEPYSHTRGCEGIRCIATPGRAAAVHALWQKIKIKNTTCSCNWLCSRRETKLLSRHRLFKLPDRLVFMLAHENNGVFRILVSLLKDLDSTSFTQLGKKKKRERGRELGSQDRLYHQA